MPRATRLRLVVLAVVAAAVAIALSQADPRRALALFAEVGLSGLLLALLPSVVSVSCEVASWQHALRGVGQRAAFFRLFAIRVASESLALCLPGGVVFAESMKLPLFAQHMGLGAAQAMVAMALRKYVVLAAQAAYLLAAAVLLSWHASADISRFSVWVAGAGCALGALALTSRSFLRAGTSARRFASFIDRCTLPKLRRSLRPRLERLAASDRAFSRFFSDRRRELTSVTLAFVSWGAEALETLVLLRLLSCEVSFLEVAAMEAMLSLLRSVVVFVPAGIGVQDAGYAFFLRALGVADATEVAIAFAFLKRSKELLWVLAGFALLAPSRRANAATAEGVPWAELESKVS